MNARSPYEIMTQTPIPRLTMRLAVPAIISMMVSTIYNMVDTWFVSHLGTLAVGACGVAFSIMSCINSIGYLLGTGGGTVIGMLLGARKQQEAAVIGSTAFFTSLALGTLLGMLGLSFVTPLMGLLGASEAILPYAVAYARAILVGFPIMSGSLVLSTILRGEGKMMLSMIGIGCGAVLNMLLDPLLIFTLGLGIRGASLATLISQTIGLVVLLFFFLTGRTQTRLSVKLVSLRANVYRRILTTGTPSLCRHAVTTLSTIALNVAAGMYGGDALIAALSIVSKVAALLQSVLKGVFQGAQSIFSYNKGARLYARVRSAYRFTLLVDTALIVLAAAAMPFIAGDIMRLFSVTDPAVAALGAGAMVMQTFSLVLMPFNSSTNMLLQSVGEAHKSALLTLLPQGVYYIPALFLLPLAFGAFGVIVAPIVGQALTALTSAPFIVWYFRTMAREEAALSSAQGTK